MADVMWETNPDAYVILEHFCDNSEEKELANYGCMIWGNMNYNYNEGTMGYNTGGKSDFSWISYKNRGWNEPHVVGYMESHDEERLMAKNINYGNFTTGYNIKDTTIALQRQELAGAFYFTIPGPKMIWQFGELGYDYHINWPGVIGEDENRCTPKPIRWDYTEDYRRKSLFEVYSALIKLKQGHDVFRTEDFSLGVSTAMKKIHLNHSSMNVTIIGNFDVSTGDITPDFQHTGYWYDYFSGDSIMVENVSDGITLTAGEFKVYTDKRLQTPQTGLGIGKLEDSSQGIQLIYPNPSMNDFTIQLALQETSIIELNVYDLMGSKVRSITSDRLSAGEYLINWDATNQSGTRVSPGIYFVELIKNNSRQVEKISVF
jgi:hypothetical protein